MRVAAFRGDLRTSSKAVSTGERRGNPTKEQHVQKNPNQQGQDNGKLPPSGGSNKQQSQSGGGRDQQGSNIKSDQGQAQSRGAQQGSDHGNRSDKQR
jgi:hypothetical protein